MGITLTVTGNDMEEIVRQIRSLDPARLPSTLSAPVAIGKEKAGPGKVASKTAESTTETTSVAETTTPANPTFDDVKAAIKSHAAEPAEGGIGKDKVVAILAKYGAKKGTELKPEDYTKFVADLKAEK